jgi:hypothetical protein
MAELNERQIAHRRAMLAHMTQMARRAESRFSLIQGGRGRADRFDYNGNAWARITSSLRATPKPGRSGISIVPPVNRSDGVSTPDRQSTSPY